MSTNHVDHKDVLYATAPYWTWPEPSDEEIEVGEPEPEDPEAHLRLINILVKRDY